jgi:hypothetical protein
MMLICDYLEVAYWVAKRVDCSIPTVGAAIGWLRDEEYTCGVLYENFTGQSITATIAVAPGAYLPKEFLRAIFRYPFVALGVAKIIGVVEQSNLAAVRLNDRLGFKGEAVIQDVFLSGAAIIYTMTKADCRWLEKDDGQEN